MKLTTKPAPWAAGALLLVALGAVVEDRHPSSIAVRPCEIPAVVRVWPSDPERILWGAPSRTFGVTLGPGGVYSEPTGRVRFWRRSEP